MKHWDTYTSAYIAFFMAPAMGLSQKKRPFVSFRFSVWKRKVSSEELATSVGTGRPPCALTDAQVADSGSVAELSELQFLSPALQSGQATSVHSRPLLFCRNSVFVQPQMAARNGVPNSRCFMEGLAGRSGPGRSQACCKGPTAANGGLPFSSRTSQHPPWLQLRNNALATPARA